VYINKKYDTIRGATLHSQDSLCT